MGQLIMLGTLFGLIVLIFGLVVYFDPEARGVIRSRPDVVPMKDVANR